MVVEASARSAATYCLVLTSIIALNRVVVTNFIICYPLAIVVFLYVINRSGYYSPFDFGAAQCVTDETGYDKI